MNIGEVLDQRAADGALGSVTLIRVGKLWQVYVTSAATGSVVARREPTPSRSLEAALNLLPFTEDYDLKHGLARINEPKAVDYETEVTPEQVAQIDAAVRDEFRTGDWQTVESEQPPGVFD